MIYFFIVLNLELIFKKELVNKSRKATNRVVRNDQKIKRLTDFKF